MKLNDKELSMKDIEKALKLIQNTDLPCECNVCTGQVTGYCWQTGIMKISSEDRTKIKETFGF